MLFSANIMAQMQTNVYMSRKAFENAYCKNIFSHILSHAREHTHKHARSCAHTHMHAHAYTTTHTSMGPHTSAHNHVCAGIHNSFSQPVVSTALEGKVIFILPSVH